MKKVFLTRMIPLVAAACFLMAGNTLTAFAEPATSQGEVSATRGNSLGKWCGSYSFIERGGSINYVYSLELDPVKKRASWRSAGISNSIGYAGTEMGWPEYWNILNFNPDKSGNSAMVRMLNLNDNSICTVKLTLNSYGNIKMTYVSGSSCPGILLNGNGGYRSVTFHRD